MSWLRLDDGFGEHPKFDGWTIAQRWAWLEVLLYCARRETEGRIPDVRLLPRNVTPALLERALASGLADRHDDESLHVHDWKIYNPPRDLDDRVREFVATHPDASANDVVKALGGNRNRILALVKRYQVVSKGGIAEPEKGGIARGHARAYPTPTPVRTTSHIPEPEPEPEATPDDDPIPPGQGRVQNGDLEHLDPRAELERIAAEGAT